MGGEVGAINVAKRPQFAWYQREVLKRSLGKFAQQIADRYYKEARCYGSVERPLLVMCHLETVAVTEKQNLVGITIENARQNWNAVISACLFLGVKFLLFNRKTPLAVLKRHDLYRHTAFEYLNRTDASPSALDNEIAAARGCIDALISAVNRIDARLQSERSE
jgi:hypothetical protein